MLFQAVPQNHWRWKWCLDTIWFNIPTQRKVRISSLELHVQYLFASAVHGCLQRSLRSLREKCYRSKMHVTTIWIFIYATLVPAGSRVCLCVCIYIYLCILRMLAWINTFVLVTALILVAVSIYFCYNNRALCYGGKLFLTPVWILSTHHPILPLGFSSCLSKRSSYSTSIPSHLLEKDAVSPWCSLSELGVAWEPCWFGQTNTHRWQTLMKMCLGNSTVPVISQQGVAEQMEDPLLRYLRAVGL